MLNSIAWILLPLIQEHGTIVKKVKETTNVEAVITRMRPMNQQKSKGNLKDIKLPIVRTAIIESDKEVSTLNCDDFMSWLMRKKFSNEDCQAFKGKL